MLAEIRDYLKNLSSAEHFSIGKIDNSKDKSLGVYGGDSLFNVDAIGKYSTYGISRIRILLHWTNDLKETETEARSLYENLRYLSDVAMGTIHVEYMRLESSEPVFIGTDENGVYEYVINATVYYRR